MAEEEEHHHHRRRHQKEEEDQGTLKLLRSYIGLSFSMFLAMLANNSVPVLQAKVRSLSLRTAKATDELRQMKSRRQEDSKANARVVEIFASHRNAWQAEEKRLLQQIEAAAEEIPRLRRRVAELEEAAARSKKEVAERDEMIGFMSRRIEEEGLGGREVYGKKNEDWFQKEEEEDIVGSTARSLEEEVEVIYKQHSQHFGNNNAFDAEFMASASKFWTEKASLWQDVQYESLESLYNAKHFVGRRESPWKVDGDSAGVSSKLRLLEQDLLNLEKIGKNEASKVSSLINKQTKRYQAISEKIDDLCRRIANDPCEPSLSQEFRTQTQTEYLLEAFRLQQGASEIGQKLMALQTEIGKSHYRDELSEATLTTRRSLDSIRNNFKEIQRNLEIWLARIIGDLEGILAREGASRVREYYISRYPFVQ